MTKGDRILGALTDAGRRGVTAFELSQITLGYRQRISDLRAKGYNVEPHEVTVRDGTRITTYILSGSSGASSTGALTSQPNQPAKAGDGAPEAPDRLFEVPATKSAITGKQIGEAV